MRLFLKNDRHRQQQSDRIVIITGVDLLLSQEHIKERRKQRQ